VDLYTGGAEHAVMHLLYARFFAKAIRDMGLVNFDEPFTRLFNQGIIIAERRKMSKSRGNVVTPDSYVSELGADAVRAYLMFVAPWEQGGEWNDSGISGVSRWLKRVWNLVLGGYSQRSGINRGEQQKAERDLSRLVHQTVRKVTEDMEKIRFNIMIAALMEFTNYLIKSKEAGAVTESAWEEAINTLVLLLAPTTPHLAEELWERKGHQYSVHNQRWLKWDKELAKDEEITLVVQVNGKLRDRIAVSASITKDEAERKALESRKVKAYLEGAKDVRMIFTGKLVNFVPIWPEGEK
jgi:leucyl-tRNA synthetase